MIASAYVPVPWTAQDEEEANELVSATSDLVKLEKREKDRQDTEMTDLFRRFDELKQK